MGRTLVVLALALATDLLVCASPVSAQAQTTGSIVGRVTDESGGSLPGVTVTATSPALQVPQVSTVSDPQGDYRLTPLPIGTYDVVYSLQGFQTLKRSGVRLTAGFVARVDEVMHIGAIEESVTVSATPTIDVQSTGSVTVLTRETLEVVPSSRAGIITLMNQSPSVRSTSPVPLVMRTSPGSTSADRCRISCRRCACTASRRRPRRGWCSTALSPQTPGRPAAAGRILITRRSKKRACRRLRTTWRRPTAAST